MSKKSKKQQPKRKEARFETSFSELMTGIGVKKARVAPQRGTATASEPMASRDRSERQQLLDSVAELQQQRRALQARVRGHEQRLMAAAEETGLLREKLRTQEAVRQQDLKRMIRQRKELTELRQSNQTLRTQRDNLQRRLDAHPAPSPPPVVSVPEPEDSDVRQAAWRLSEVFRDLNIERLLIVGGSPNYHIQLQALFGDTLQVRLIDGQARRNLKQARADVLWADLAVIWGGTILAHRVSELYTGDSVILIPHRGIVGMMRQLRDALSG
ncbi:MAG: hypothetical protein P8R54_31940 [Myxococcota bacterium]|nr:hypothetical protein [Myxococcota bacterium]